MTRALPAIFIVSAVVAISSVIIPGWFWLHVAARPIATGATILVAATATARLSETYQRLVVASLVLALATDVLALLPGDHLMASLLSMAASQAALIAAITGRAGWARRKLAFLAYALVVSPLLAAVFPAVSASFRVPVVLYVAAIAIAAAQGASWMLSSNTRASQLVAQGTALLVISGATFVIDRFRTTIPYHDAIVLGSYWLALWCVARSVSAADAPLV